MALNIHSLIAAVSPDIFCDPSLKGKVKSIIAEKGKPGYKDAALIAKPKESGYMDFDAISLKSPFDLSGFKEPIEKHTLIYDSFGENLEPVYFWILDALNTEYKDMKKVEKLVDNFLSSPGSGHFSELGQKATKMQEEAMKMLGAANQLVKSVLNIVYDLKEFKLRLKLYDKYNDEKNPRERHSALLSLKQVWMDTVDQKRGNTAIKMMSQQFQYTTIIDAFMAANSLEDITKSVDAGGLDLNDRVKRILEQRVGEFFDWISASETELRKRYSIEKNYLISQVNTLKLYARWVKPYLKAAKALEQRASPTAALVTSFNTVLFELVLFGQSEYHPREDVGKGDLPEMFKDIKARKYCPIIVIELSFRSVPERAGQGYGFRGRFEAIFTSYALNEQEIAMVKEFIDKDDMEDVFALVEGSTNSLEQIQKDIDDFLNEDNAEEKKKMEKKSEDVNPFSALFSFFKSSPSSEKNEEKKSDKILPDSQIEKVIRSQAVIKSRQECRKIYDMYKKAHNMPAA